MLLIAFVLLAVVFIIAAYFLGITHGHAEARAERKTVESRAVIEWCEAVARADETRDTWVAPASEMYLNGSKVRVPVGTTPSCYAGLIDQRCDKDGPGGFMGHTCAPDRGPGS